MVTQQLQITGAVLRSMVSANHWLSSIKINRLSWYLTLVSANHWISSMKANRLSWYLTLVSANHASSNSALVGKPLSLATLNYDDLYAAKRDHDKRRMRCTYRKSGLTIDKQPFTNTWAASGITECLSRATATNVMIVTSYCGLSKVCFRGQNITIVHEVFAEEFNDVVH